MMVSIMYIIVRYIYYFDHYILEDILMLFKRVKLCIQDTLL